MDDPYDLHRFVVAQEEDFDLALREITNGRKESHWRWYIFPQIDGLAFSAKSRHFAIKSDRGARAYLQHPTLGLRLTASAEAALAHEGKSATDIFGWPDDLKLRSSATLFASISPAGSVFHRLLDRFFPEGPDEKTLRLLGLAKLP